MVIGYWFYVADYYFVINSTSVDDEDNLRLKDSKASTIWERNFWSLTFYVHG